MEEDRPFDEAEFFRAIAQSGARVLLIGRRALIALGLPVLTHDYDLWVHRDDLDALNRALAPLGFVPSRTVAEAHATGRYVLQDTEHVDVLVAQGVGTFEGTRVGFDALWANRQQCEVAPGVMIALPELDDLIETKKFARRAKDADDLRLLEILRRERTP